MNDADLLVGQIDEYFPILVGNTVVGPVAEIRWGVGDLLVGQLGVVISMPQELIVVLGSVEIIVPTREAPILELHLDTLGAIDLASPDPAAAAAQAKEAGVEVYDATVVINGLRMHLVADAVDD